MPWYHYNNRGVPQQDAPPDPIPVGTITPIMGENSGPFTVPTGWLLCDGSAHATVTYPDLSAILVPGPPPVNFNVPNFNTCFPLGSGNLAALGTTDTSAARHTHNHGGATDLATPHSHSVPSHTHGIPNHQHAMTHAHDSNHRHGAGSLYAPIKVNQNEKFTNSTIAPTRTGVGGWLSSDRHRHDVSGESGTSGTAHLTTNMNPDVFLDLDGGGTSEGSGALVTQSLNTMPVSTGAPILPPYLNIYFIIKAEDLSGQYT